jgi:molybdopterin-guanine dinucleotide biosynthesis protein A
VPRLHQARRDAGVQLACAASGGRRHPVVALWPVALREDLRRALVEERVRRVGEQSARYTLAVAEWPNEPLDPFLNVNTPEDVAEAERLAALYPDA